MLTKQMIKKIEKHKSYFILLLTPLKRYYVSFNSIKRLKRQKNMRIHN